MGKYDHITELSRADIYPSWRRAVELALAGEGLWSHCSDGTNPNDVAEYAVTMPTAAMAGQPTPAKLTTIKEWVKEDAQAKALIGRFAEMGITFSDSEAVWMLLHGLPETPQWVVFRSLTLGLYKPPVTTSSLTTTSSTTTTAPSVSFKDVAATFTKEANRQHGHQKLAQPGSEYAITVSSSTSSERRVNPSNGVHMHKQNPRGVFPAHSHTLRNTACKLVGEWKEKHRGVSNEEGNLIFLDLTFITPSDPSLHLKITAFAKVPLSWDLWHVRLGHLGGDAVKRLPLFATVNISQFTEVQLPQRYISPPAEDTRGEDQLQSNENDFWNIGNDFDSLNNDFGVAGESLEEKCEGAGACYLRNGLTFLDVFDTDEYAEYRKDNLFYPFASKEEWEVADYLLCSSLSMAAIDEFLKLRMIQNLQLSFSNARELHSHAEMLPSRPSWKCQIIPSIHLTKLPIRLFWRDPVECLESLFSNPLFHDKLNFIFHHVYKMAARLLRVYSEWLTGDSAWDMQSQYPRGATILSTVLSSNKTNITTMTGTRIAHPLLLSLANISYIVDTPEAAMLVCMCRKTSPFTMASYLQFGDHFRHPARTRAITLAQLASITVDPNDLEAYFEACAEHWLNGVYAPFWEGFPHADPSIFLTPELLHHWHKEFYDHSLQWCLKVVGTQELDFRFSILQPITGYHHFAGGILKLKQVTGRVHHDIQHYIVSLISGVARLRYVPSWMSGARMGVKKPINNWFIPKLELLQSITSSMRKVGALIQWSMDATEHAHVSEIKDPARCTNDNNYDPQICHHLDCEEKLRHFTIATTLKSHPKSHDLDCSPIDIPKEDEGEEDDIDYDEWEPSDLWTALLEEMNHTRITTNYFRKAKQFATLSRRELAYPPQMFIGGTTAIHLNYDPSHGRVKVEDISIDYNILDLHVVLSDFLQHDARARGVVHEVASRRRPLIDCPPILPFDRIQVWHSTIHASPSDPGWPKGQQDFVLVNVDRATQWPKSGLTGHAICELYLVIRPIPQRGSRIKWRDQYLCYVQCLNIGPIDPATRMHTLKHAKHADGSPVGNFILLNQLHTFISIIPQLRDVADV
ncbi:hypothetical protein DFH29DRAFT_879790 [Suillus ampliporus]|nr:hypothetical protein DFH29DRAFT_879790 [Suillus ampliporus]